MNRAQSGEVILTRNTSSIVSWQVIVLTLYAALILIGALQHEIWRDEAQSWLIVRDMSLFQLFQHMNYEGTPALWHLIIMPFAKLGFPPQTITFIHIFIAFTTATIFVRKAPFSRTIKLVFLFSFYMAWEYAVIARNYNLTVLILFAIAANYKNRFVNPIIYSSLIFLLFNTNVHSFFMAFGLACLYWFEKAKHSSNTEKFKLSNIIILLGILVAIIQLIPAEDNMRAGLFYKSNYLALPRSIINAFTPIPWITKANFIVYALLALIGSVTLAYSCLYLLKRNRQIFYLYLFAISGLFYLFIFKHFGGYRHHGFIMIFLLFSLWIADDEKSKHHLNSSSLLDPFTQKKTMLLIQLSLVFSLFGSAFMHINEQTMKYSGAKDMAAYLSAMDLTHKVVIGSPATLSSSLLPYLPHLKFWYPESEAFGTFVVWNNRHVENRDISWAVIEERIEKNNLDNKNSLLLLNSKLPKSTTSHYQLIHKVDQDLFSLSNERYYLYQIK